MLRLLARRGALVAAMFLVGCGSDGGDVVESTPPPPSLVAGTSSVAQVVIDDTAIDYIVVVPDGFVAGDVAPVLLALPPGGQDLDITTNVVRGTYQPEALARGWVVVSPAAPEAGLYFQGSERLIPGLLDFITSWVTPEGGSVHLAGISNGGISAFRAATQNPDRFASVLVFPGFPRSDADFEWLDRLTAIPVHMFVGERDEGWIPRMQDTFDRLTELGGDVTLQVVPGEDHVIRSLSNGTQVFDLLDAAR